jgi:lactate dehydrogenase-like 2-hydroxyacid dehydrogenase
MDFGRGWESCQLGRGGTLHSDAFFAKADFRRVQQVDLPLQQARHTAGMSERPIILTGFHFTKTMLAMLAERYEIAGHMDKPDPSLVPAAAQPHVQALVTTGSVGASDALMAAMPRLSLICCYGTGYERIDLAAARRRNIMVTHGADANAPDVAEMTMGILLASTRRIVRADKMIRRGDWTKRIPNRFGAIAGLTGGKLGILGLGAIGLELAKRAKGFDVEIGYCNRNMRDDVDYRYFPDVIALATWADYLVVCLRSDASNRHIINAEVLKALGPRGHLVNVSRGWAVDEADLAEALRNNVIEGAALDVYDEEPYEGQELLPLDNLVMTPHFGGGTEHAHRRMTKLVRRNLDSHFAGQPVVSPLPELRDMATRTEGRLR